MLRLAVISVLVAAAFAATPVLQGKHFTAYKLQDTDINTKSPKAFGEYTEVVNGQTRTIIENPTQYEVPEDTGGNFGDLEFSGRPKTGRLISRDTIVNQDYEEDVHIYYTRTFPGYYIEDMRVINVGRERAFTRSGSISHALGSATANIYVGRGKTARVFIEVYVRADNED